MGPHSSRRSTGYGQWIENIGQICEGKTIPDTHWNMIAVHDLCTAHRLAAESAVDHGAIAGGPRYGMYTANGQFFIAQHQNGHPPGHPSDPAALADRVQALFPDFAVDGLDGDGLATAGWINNTDCKKARAALNQGHGRKC